MSEEAVQAAEAPEAAAAGTEEKTEAAAAAPVEAPASNEAVSYQAVEKEGTVTAIWEMQGQRTCGPSIRVQTRVNRSSPFSKPPDKPGRYAREIHEMTRNIFV